MLSVFSLCTYIISVFRPSEEDYLLQNNTVLFTMFLVLLNLIKNHFNIPPTPTKGKKPNFILNYSIL